MSRTPSRASRRASWRARTSSEVRRGVAVRLMTGSVEGPPSRGLPPPARGKAAGSPQRQTRDMETRVGAVARRTRTISRRDIELFTEISGDRNPIHYDEELAAQSRFGRVVVQGGVTSGLLNAVVAEDLPGPGSVFLEVGWKFRAPVGPGDEITAEVTVTSVREDKPITTLDTRITNQDGVVVLDGTAVVWRDPAVAESVADRPS